VFSAFIQVTRKLWYACVFRAPLDYESSRIKKNENDFRKIIKRYELNVELESFAHIAARFKSPLNNLLV
jgi:hypothetical protein